MVSWWVSQRRKAVRCRRRYSWSTSRGGCRFVTGHHGLCKPVSR